ncbi:hypothetical protein EJ04DRAFT_574091 [Polyplosphaeria fusca]|uniref:Uncharacterized protein n=1 Tax=Polyplosphaeria fusca TaxID=682080 RepID=A0A9P4R700_9PLEO|nr:hypothetical protein EJ04DRAFT_574091 [Polyplosphaeria fusca]
MASLSPPGFVCFANGNGPQKHYFSASQLFKAGVWIGYMSSDRRAESYKGLPSYSDLKANKRSQRQDAPCPPTTEGVAGEERHAICRGCHGTGSRVITLREIAYIPKTKLVIMPLGNNQEEGLFCILLPQPNDRSLPKLQAYRPYETRGQGHGQTFSNDFVLLTLRNRSHSYGTLEAAVQLLVGSPASASNPAEHPFGTETNASLRHTPIKSSRSQSRHTLVREQQATLGSRDELTPPLSISHRESQGASFIALDLTDDQCQRVIINWTVKTKEVEYEFVYTLDQCERFADLLDLMRQDAEIEPEVMHILGLANRWRIQYQLPKSPVKVFHLRPGREEGWEFLQTRLAQSSAWMEHEGLTVNVALVAVLPKGK